MRVSSSSVGSATSSQTLEPGSSMRSLARAGSNASSSRTPSLYRRHVIMSDRAYPTAYAPPVNAIAPLAGLFAAVDARLERVAPMPWGAVVTDPRFPLIHDVNYARVEDGSGLTLAAVGRSLAPALGAAGVRAFHVATFDPVGSRLLLDELEAERARFTYDTAMRWKGPSPALRAHHDVEELDPADLTLWDEQAALLPLR